MINEEIISKIKSGATVRVHEIVKDFLTNSKDSKKGKSGQTKTRNSIFEGLVLAHKHGNEPGGTFTVRATVAGVGVEKIYPIHSPVINKIEILNSPKKVSRAKLYYLRGLSKKQIRQKVGNIF